MLAYACMPTVPDLGEFFPAILICATNITIINTINKQHLLFDVMSARFSSRYFRRMSRHILHVNKQITFRNRVLNSTNCSPVPSGFDDSCHNRYRHAGPVPRENGINHTRVFESRRTKGAVSCTKLTSYTMCITVYDTYETYLIDARFL